MNKFFFPALLLIVGLSACKNDKTDANQNNGTGQNAEMIHNGATAEGPVDTNSMARIRFEEPVFDFGEAKEGDVVFHKFRFTNVGKVPLTILKARSTCGCTIPEWPDEPIAPGGTGEIIAKFNTDMKKAQQKKVITVTANTYPNDTKITLKGLVNENKD